MYHTLHLWADRIELVLAQHKLAVRVIGGVVTPQTIRFQVLPGPGTRLRRIADLTEEIAMSLGVSRCRVFREQGCLQVEVPRAGKPLVSLSVLCQKLNNVPPYTAVLGLDHEGSPLLLDLSSPDATHALIAGQTGSGKTELARSMIASLAHYNRQAQLQLVLIDPKNRGFAPFCGLPHLLQPVATEPNLAITALHHLVEEMIRRDRESRSAPHIIVFIDELADLVIAAPKEIHALLTRLAQRGREAGLHLVACTQKPIMAMVGSLVKANFPVRLVGSVATPEDAKTATGLARTGAERLLGRGDFLAIAHGEIIRFQAAFIAESEIRTFIGEGCSNGRLVQREATSNSQRRNHSLAFQPRLYCLRKSN